MYERIVVGAHIALMVTTMPLLKSARAEALVAFRIWDADMLACDTLSVGITATLIEELHNIRVASFAYKDTIECS